MTGDPGPAIAAATALRERGLRVQLYAEPKKLKAKLSYGDKLQIPFAVLLGEDEIAGNTLTVKNMRTGEQRTCAPEEAAAWIGTGVDNLNAGPVIREN